MFISMFLDVYVMVVVMGWFVGIFNIENGNLEELLEEVYGGNIIEIVLVLGCFFFWYFI